MTTPQSIRVSRRQRLRQGALIGGITALLVCGLFFLNLFAGIRLRLNDAYFTNLIRSDEVVIVALDDQSLSAYGRSPAEWSRTIYADLIGILSGDGARVIAFDLLFVEATEDDSILAEAILAARQSDTGTRTVLAAAGAGDLRATGIGRLAYDGALRPVSLLAETGVYTGFVNTVSDVDVAIRRQPSRFLIGEDETLSFALTTYLAYLRVPMAAFDQIVVDTPDGLKVAERLLTVDQQGLWLQNYFGPPGEAFPVYSLQAVINGEVAPQTFTGKIVLVGLYGAQGATDRYDVPSSPTGETMYGVEIQAHALQSLISDTPLREQATSTQLILIVIFSVGAALIYTQLIWYGKILLAPVLIVLFFAVASVYFDNDNLVINLFYPILALILPAIIGLGIDTTNEINRRRKTELLLDSVVGATDQGMDLAKLLPRIAADVQRILPARFGTIALPEQRYHFPSDHADLGPLIDRAQQQWVIEGAQVAFPIRWNQQPIGVIALESAKPIDTETRGLLTDLADQIAPTLQVAILYDEMRRQKLMQDSILSGSPALSVVLRADRTVMLGNDAFIQWIKTDLKHQDLLALLRENGLSDDTYTTLTRRFQAERDFQEQIKIGAQSFNVYADLLPNYRLWVVIMSDVSALADLNRLKTQMIRMASHDLKNPLSTVMGYSSLLLMDEDMLSPEHSRYVKSISKAADLMHHLIEEILNLEQLRSTELPMESISLSDLAFDVITRHQPELEAKRQTFEYGITHDLPHMRGRPTHIAQVISNLLGNAIKYTPEGGAVKLFVYQTKTGRLRLEVKDTGYGISEEAQAKLFTEFYRVKTASTAGIPGTGLGLSLVKSIVEAHDGQIWVNSQENVGSSFFVEFPREESS
ncbi:MAG: CHASE2 domain-containing protein [Anaerolineae bacterium]|jgi:signal transduction histidine kinase/CHASE2 domain-containing sensor protein|nr:CHASE2 domain-containing protein [Anaerolineae bacterium]